MGHQLSNSVSPNTQPRLYAHASGEPPLKEMSRTTLLVLYAAGQDARTNCRALPRNLQPCEGKDFACRYAEILDMVNQASSTPLEMTPSRNRVYRHLFYWTNYRLINVRQTTGNQLFLQERAEALFDKADSTGLLPFILSRNTSFEAMKALHLYTVLMTNLGSLVTTDNLVSLSGLLESQVRKALSLLQEGFDITNSAGETKHLKVNLLFSGDNKQYLKLAPESIEPFPQATVGDLFDVSDIQIQTASPNVKAAIQPKVSITLNSSQQELLQWEASRRNISVPDLLRSLQLEALSALGKKYKTAKLAQLTKELQGLLAQHAAVQSQLDALAVQIGDTQSLIREEESRLKA